MHTVSEYKPALGIGVVDLHGLPTVDTSTGAQLPFMREGGSGGVGSAGAHAGVVNHLYMVRISSGLIASGPTAFSTMHRIAYRL